VSAQQFTINPTVTYQTIDGFGGSEPKGAGASPPPGCCNIAGGFQAFGTAIQRGQILDLLFSPSLGIGLTILRVEIPPDMQTSDGVFHDNDSSDAPQFWVMQEAVKRYPQVKIMASVWSPPGWMKTNGVTYGGYCSNDGSRVCTQDANCVFGDCFSGHCTSNSNVTCSSNVDCDGYCPSGSVTTSHYQDFANFLSHFVLQYVNANNNSSNCTANKDCVSIYAVSMANEPDTEGVLWDTCAWNTVDISTFLNNYLAPTFQSNGVTAKIISPEAADWDYVEHSYPPQPLPSWNLGPYLSSPESTGSHFDIAAGHIYGGNRSQSFSTALGQGKKAWQTEWYFVNGTNQWAQDGGLAAAKVIHDSLSSGQVSTWNWWKLIDYGTDPLIQLMNNNGVYTYAPSKSFWALGNFSKFVRPGFVRISGSPASWGGLCCDVNGTCSATTCTSDQTCPFSDPFCEVVDASAYKDPVSGEVVTVVVNAKKTAQSVIFAPTGGLTFGPVTPYITDGYVSSLYREPDVSLRNAQTIPAESVVTFVPNMSDVVWRSSADGSLLLWFMMGATVQGQPTIANPGSQWVIQGVGDFDGDGKNDILWRTSSNNGLSIWFMNGSTVTSTASPSDPGGGWAIQAIGDFDGDGKSDILWRTTSNNGLAIWFMNGGTHHDAYPTDPQGGWVIQRVGDFDGDGKSDILWRLSTNNGLAIWFMNGGVISSQAWPTDPQGGWVIQRVGDFDGDGKADILWRLNTNNGLAIWFMNGGTIGSQAWPTDPGGSWAIRGLGDFNGDGKADLLWRTTANNASTIWFMNGATATSQAVATDPGTSFSIQGTGHFD
jgi:O-glycosyl hydrolase